MNLRPSVSFGLTLLADRRSGGLVQLNDGVARTPSRWRLPPRSGNLSDCCGSLEIGPQVAGRPGCRCPRCALDRLAYHTISTRLSCADGLIRTMRRQPADSGIRHRPIGPGRQAIPEEQDAVARHAKSILIWSIRRRRSPHEMRDWLSTLGMKNTLRFHLQKPRISGVSLSVNRSKFRTNRFVGFLTGTASCSLRSRPTSANNEMPGLYFRRTTLATDSVTEKRRATIERLQPPVRSVPPGHRVMSV